MDDLVSAIPEGQLGYREAKKYASAAHPEVRRALARRGDVRPEILFYLAGDSDVGVRRAVAGNPATPPQAAGQLAVDADLEVRSELAEKIARLVPQAAPDERRRLFRATTEALERLARDEMVRVRRILADALKDCPDVPREVILRLAGDDELSIAVPVLEMSPVLTESDLIEIIATGPMQEALGAIASRRGLSAPVADAIHATGSVRAIGALLSNHSAQIREETLDRIIDRAPEVPAWHAPLVRRPELSAGAGRRIAGFVARELIDELVRRGLLGEDGARGVADDVRARLDHAASPDADGGESAERARADVSSERARALHAMGHLSEAEIMRGIETGDRAFVVTALGLQAGFTPAQVERVLALKGAKAIMALAWQAGHGSALGTRLQTRLAGIMPDRALRGGPEGEFPLSDNEMSWQLEVAAGPA